MIVFLKSGNCGEYIQGFNVPDDPLGEPKIVHTTKRPPMIGYGEGYCSIAEAAEDLLKFFEAKEQWVGKLYETDSRENYKHFNGHTRTGLEGWEVVEEYLFINEKGYVIAKMKDGELNLNPGDPRS